MRTAILLLCVISAIDMIASRSAESIDSARQMDRRSESSLENAEQPAAVRLPRKFRGNSRTRRVHIENQHGFDGKVEKIHINSEEDLPGARAHGIPKKNTENNGNIQKIQGEIEPVPRVTRAIEAYGKSKEHLEMNGRIEIVQSPAATNHQTRRTVRSIEDSGKPETETAGKNTDDLEAQDAKVFRPLFVYRQQQAKKYHLGRNHVHGYESYNKPYYYRQPVY